MKVFIAAIACHPTAGSEAYVGWQAVNILRREHELVVLTSVWCREAIEKAVKTGEGWERVRFVYVDEKRGEKPCHPNRLIARLQSWIDYRRWCKDAKEMAQQLILQERFDLAHHVTYASWRMGSPLAGLGIPWIWGPIGGGEEFPWLLAPLLSPIAFGFELARLISNWVGLLSSAPRHAARTATFILPNNRETESLVTKLGAKREKVRLLAQSFLTEKGLARFRAEGKRDPQSVGRLEIVAGGNLEGRKGVAIAIRALALAKSKGVPFRYRYFGRGPELVHLQRLVGRLRLDDEISFLDSLGGEEYSAMMKEAHVYLLPSLREGVPVTQLEAMAAGCVPVVADCGGAGPMAGSAGVKAVSVGSAKSMAEEIDSLLLRYWTEPQFWEKQSESCVSAIRQNYSASHYDGEMKLLFRLTAETRLISESSPTP